MTFGELKTLVSVWLDDLEFGYFTQNQVGVWLNNAQLEAQKQLIQAGQNWYMTCATTNTVMNSDCYALPSDFLKLHKIEVVVSGEFPNDNTVRLIPVTPVEADGLGSGIGRPSAYFLKKDCIVLRVTPDNTYQLNMLYSPRVVNMTVDSEEPNVPPEYHQYLAVLATLDGFLRDQRDPGPFLEKKRYYEELMKQEAQERTVDQGRGIVGQGYDFAVYPW